MDMDGIREDELTNCEYTQDNVEVRKTKVLRLGKETHKQNKFLSNIQSQINQIEREKKEVYLANDLK